MPRPRRDLTGQRFGRLTVAHEVPNVTRTGRPLAGARWLCVCDCGKETKSIGAQLSNGTSQSCGCIAREKTRQRKGDPKFKKSNGSKRFPGYDQGLTYLYCRYDNAAKSRSIPF